MYMKSLLNLGFSLSNTIFVDDTAIQMRSQPLNGILIQSFKGQISDSALMYLGPFLKFAATVKTITMRRCFIGVYSSLTCALLRKNCSIFMTMLSLQGRGGVQKPKNQLRKTRSQMNCLRLTKKTKMKMTNLERLEGKLLHWVRRGSKEGARLSGGLKWMKKGPKIR